MFKIAKLACLILIYPDFLAGKISYHVENETVVLPCQQLTDKPIWYGPPKLTIYAIGVNINSNLSKKDRLSIVHSDGSAQYDLRIRYFSNDDEGQYKCFRKSKTGVKELYFNLKKTKAPSNLTIEKEDSTKTVHGYLNKLFNLICTVNQGIPTGKLMWIVNNNTLNETGESSIVYSFKPRKKDHLKLFTCETRNNITEFRLQRSVQLFVYMPPSVLIYSDHNPVIVHEGDDLTIYCNYSSNSNITYLKWTRFLPLNSQVRTTDSSQDLVFQNIERRNAGQYICTVSNIAGNGSDNVTVQVNYPPTIEVTFVEHKPRRELHCKPTGVPNKYRFKEWEHRTEYYQLIRRLPNKGSVLNLQSIKGESDRHHDRGIYVCQASNNVIMNGSLFTSGEMFLQAQGKPYFVTSNNRTQYGLLGNMSSLTVEVVSFPELTSLSINPDVLKDSNDKYTVDDVQVLDTVYSKSVFVNGSRITIPVNVKTDKYFRQYTVKVSNQNGSSSFNVTLESASPPEKPSILDLKPKKNQIILKWRAGFNGGFPQTFIIQYRRLDVQYWNSISVKDNTIYTCSIHGLTPGTEYLIRLYSTNTEGNSSLSKEVLITTDDTNDNTNFVLLLLIVPFLIAVAVLYWQYKKGNLRPLDRIRLLIILVYVLGNYNKKEKSCCKWQPFIDAGGIGAVENHFYENQNNEVHNAVAQNMDMPVYNSIERRAHLSIGQCVSYSATPKRKPNPLGKNMIDIACFGASSASGNTAESKCPDELNYIDVCFEPKPSGHKFQIHGSDNKTDYVDIDFSKRICSFAESERNSDDDFSSIDDIRMMRKGQ